MSSELLKLALNYAELGWYVFPLVPNKKVPATKNGFKDATLDLEQIKKWWTEIPSANIGIATGSRTGIAVVDIDVKNGSNGFESLKTLAIDTNTLTSLTPSGGRHLYYVTSGKTINSKTRILPGIDIKAEGGYVVAPGSVIDGKKYEWLEPETSPISFPECLLEITSKPASEPKLEEGVIIPEGERNAKLTSIAGSLRRRGIERDEILAVLKIINQSRCRPPLSDRELEKIASSISRYQPDNEPLPPELSEDALALEFTKQHSENWRYVANWGSWLHWDGRRWQRESTLKAYDLARQVCRNAACRAPTPKSGSKIASASTVSAVEKLARADRRHASTTEQWDRDVYVLNTPAGEVDLRTGQINIHNRLSYLTKITNASLAPPQTPAPLWQKFLDEITNHDRELQLYLARVVGYALTGVTSEHALFFLYGTGANGKSVFLNTISTILGDYAASAPVDTFLENRTEKHPTDLAGLRGARLVTSVEIERGRRWAESKIKLLTGGDKISARFMRQDFFEYKPQFKIIIAGNNKPAIRDIDEAMKRRLHLIPFTVTIPPEQRDKTLQEKLLEERDAILRWAVDGCLEWQRIGLKPPECVVSATEEYFESEDYLGRWLEEECIIEKNISGLTDELFESWKLWAEKNNEIVGSKRRFSDELNKRGFKRARFGREQKRGFYGIGLKSNHHQESII